MLRVSVTEDARVLLQNGSYTLELPTRQAVRTCLNMLADAYEVQGFLLAEQPEPVSAPVRTHYAATPEVDEFLDQQRDWWQSRRFPREAWRYQPRPAPGAEPRSVPPEPPRPGSQAALVYAYLKQHPEGSTFSEIESLLGYPVRSVTRTCAFLVLRRLATVDRAQEPWRVYPATE